MDRATPFPHTPGPHRKTLGDLLCEARATKGLELRDVAETTHIRREYLKAFDEGRYENLPEDVYAKNFLRLYAQTVGLDDKQMLALYTQERRGTPFAEEAPYDQDEDEPGRKRRSGLFDTRAIRPTLLSALLVAGVVAVAVWSFNNLLFPDTTTALSDGSPPQQTVSVRPAEAQTSAEGEEPDTAGAAETDAADAAAAGDVESMVLFSLSTTPPGAQVSIDNYDFPGPSPIVNAPVTPGQGKVLRVSLDGYRTHEAPIDITNDRNLSLWLQPDVPGLAATAPSVTADASTQEAGETGETAAAAEGEATTEAATETAAETTTEAAAPGTVRITVEQETWLEVYSGTARNQGERLLFRTAEPGETFEYPLPVYVHTGNAAGVLLSIGGSDAGAMGSSGTVTGRAITQP